MKKIVITLFIVLIQFIFIPVTVVNAVTPPDRGLGAADSYAIFGKAGVTNTGAPTHIWGNVGADSSVIGLVDATQVDGTIITDGDTAGVATDASSTYDSLMSITQGSPSGLDLAGTNTVGPGVYTVGATTLNGTLTLDGDGVYIFRSSSSNSIPHSGTMNLINGATACNVFWAIADSMSIGTGADITGTIIAQTGSVTIATNATLVGRAISLIASVTLDSNQVTEPTCAVSPTPTPTSAPITSTTSTANALTSAGTTSSYCEDLSDQIIPPSIVESRRVDSDSIFVSWGPYSGTNTFNVRYGTENGEWSYNTDVTGFSTTINNLPTNSPVWIQVAARNYCTIGEYGPSSLVGGVSLINPLIPGLPNTGIGPGDRNILLIVFSGTCLSLVIFYLIHSHYWR